MLVLKQACKLIVFRGVRRSRSDRPTHTQQPQQGEGTQNDLGPFSLSGAGVMGREGGRSTRSMYINYFEELERGRGEDGEGDV